MSFEPNIISVPQLASRLAQTERQVRYLIEQQCIEPVGTIGSANVYPVETIGRLEKILDARAARRREAAAT